VNDNHTVGHMFGWELCKHAPIDAEGERVVREAMSKLGLSARAYDKVLRMARTIANLAGEENVSSTHLSEAIQYRRLDRQL
jgi:magnesium chelatase family protein